MSTALTLERADGLIATALAAAAEAGVSVSVAVVDAGGALRAFARTDGATPFTAAVAVDKAWTAATSGVPTHVWNAHMADPAIAPLAGLPRMMAVAGGHPLLSEGSILGGVGVSGGTCDQDQEIAANAAMNLT